MDLLNSTTLVAVVVELEIFKSSEINIRFGHMLDDDLFTVAAFLDPNHKLKWCKKDQVKSNAVKCAVRKLMEKADVVKPAVKNSKRSEPVSKKAAVLYHYSDEEPD